MASPPWRTNVRVACRRRCRTAPAPPITSRDIGGRHARATAKTPPTPVGGVSELLPCPASSAGPAVVRERGLEPPPSFEDTALNYAIAVPARASRFRIVPLTCRNTSVQFRWVLPWPTLNLPAWCQNGVSTPRREVRSRACIRLRAYRRTADEPPVETPPTRGAIWFHDRPWARATSTVSTRRGLVLTHGLSRSRDPAQAVGRRHPGGLGIELVSQLLESLSRPPDLLVCVSHVHHLLKQGTCKHSGATTSHE